MLSFYNFRKLPYNKNIINYSLKSTEKSIKRMVENKKLVYNVDLRNLNELNRDVGTNLINNSICFVYFPILSLSALLYYFLKNKM